MRRKKSDTHYKNSVLGEDSKATQTLFVLKPINSKNESVATAYFLDVDVDGDVDQHSMSWTVGKNNAGGSFTLKTQPWEDIGDGTIVNEKTFGTLTYNQGYLKGIDEPVKCLRK